MDKFKEMQAFAAVAEQGSFVKAAQVLDTSKAAVSRYVADLELRLETRLMHRTTRRLSLTDEGQVFLAHCTETLSLIKDAEDELQSRRAQVSGLIRINAPVSFGALHLAPLWGKFMGLYPQIKLEVTLSDRIVDVVDEGYDMAIRIADLTSSSLICKQLARTRMVLCASPQYLKGKPPITHPADLHAHAVIAYSYWSTGDEWVFQSDAGKVSVKTNPKIRSNNGDTCRAAALAHQGVILQPTFIVGSDLQKGDLVELLPAYQSLALGIYAVYPSRKLLSPRLRALIDFLAQSFDTEQWHA